MAEEQKLASGSGALQNVFGTGDENIRLLEKLMRVRVALRGGDIVVEGEEERDVDNTREILKKLCTLAEKGERVDTAVVQYAVSLLEKGELDQLDNLYGEIVATTFRGRPIRCKTLGQREYVRAIRRNTLTFGVGPAGNGQDLSGDGDGRRRAQEQGGRAHRADPSGGGGGRKAGLPARRPRTRRSIPTCGPLYDAMFDMLGADDLPAHAGARRD